MDRKNGDALTFSEIRTDELEKRIAPGRDALPEGATNALAGQLPQEPGRKEFLESAATPPPVETRIGLALSGGGIRSATFSLGVIQGLARHGKLERLDYLSTVSGGGYIGGWLTAWVARAGNANGTSGIQKVTNELNGSMTAKGAEAKEVEWLRRYSNYLTPRVGALSMDALTVVATWLRNTMLNLIILVATISSALLLPKLVNSAFEQYLPSPQVSLGVSLFFAIVSLAAVIYNLTLHYFPRSRQKSSGNQPPHTWALEPTFVTWLAIVPGFLSSAISIFGVFSADKWTTETVIYYAARAALGFLVVAAVVWLLALRKDAGNVHLEQKAAAARDGQSKDVIDAIERTSVFSRLKELLGGKIASDTLPSTVWVGFVCLFAILVAVGMCAALLMYENQSGPQRWTSFGTGEGDSLTRIIAFGPPLTLLSFGLSLTVAIGLIGRAYVEVSREWLSRFGGALIFGGVVWVAWCGLAFYSPIAMKSLYEQSKGWFSSLASISWLGSLIGALLLGAFQSGSKSQPMSKWRGYLISAFFAIVVAGVFVAIACMLDNVLNHSSNLSDLSWAFAISVAISVIFAWRVDINRFSLHDMYKMRIIRCYLGASNRVRNPQPFTGFDPDDDMPLKKFRDQRPFHILNTTLNLTQGSELAWQQRKGGSFVLTPAYCGFELSAAQNSVPLHGGRVTLPGFAPTADYASEDENSAGGLTLGMAVATSGAAASPNMGAQSNPALAVLMTFLNVRLGRWCPNPSMPNYKKSSPSFGLVYLLGELLGFTNDTSDFVYLSDGGHFENTAVYELVRRKCTHIVMVDAGADPARSFEDLGNMLHKCRVDFGVEIDLPLTTLFGQPQDLRSAHGWAIGEIRYRNGTPGKLLIIKPSLLVTKSEPADIYNYATSDPTFPQQTTLDQWFDEAQFEGYRKLGHDLCDEAIKANPKFW